MHNKRPTSLNAARYFALIICIHAYSLITPTQILPHCCRTNRRRKALLDLHLRLDPHADPHGETSGRNQWNKQATTSSFSERKAPESLAAQWIEAPRAVGKDEVGSSNLPSSSKTARFLRKTGCFDFLGQFVAS